MKIQMRHNRWLTLSLLLPLLVSAPAAGVEEKILSVATNPIDQDFIAAFDLSAEAGSRGQIQAWKWSDLEPIPGKYDMVSINDAINTLARQRGFILLVTLMAVNTTKKETPSDLKEVPFNDSRMKARFHDLIDAIAPLMDSRVRYIAIGNEADVYLARNPDQWAAYQEFYEDAAEYVRTKIPGVKVGVCVTYSGADGPQREKVQALTTKSDIWVTTYYPLGDDFRPLGPDAVTVAIPEMVRLGEGKPVIIQEIGYPSSPEVGGSEDAQARFVAAALKAWNQAGEKVPFMSFWCLNDLSRSEGEQLAAYYGLGNSAAFKAFLCSLGLRRSDGTPKPAWQALVDGVRSSGTQQPTS